MWNSELMSAERWDHPAISRFLTPLLLSKLYSGSQRGAIFSISCAVVEQITTTTSSERGGEVREGKKKKEEKEEGEEEGEEEVDNQKNDRKEDRKKEKDRARKKDWDEAEWEGREEEPDEEQQHGGGGGGGGLFWKVTWRRYCWTFW